MMRNIVSTAHLVSGLGFVLPSHQQACRPTTSIIFWTIGFRLAHGRDPSIYRFQTGTCSRVGTYSTCQVVALGLPISIFQKG